MYHKTCYDSCYSLLFECARKKLVYSSFTVIKKPETSVKETTGDKIRIKAFLYMRAEFKPDFHKEQGREIILSQS